MKIHTFRITPGNDLKAELEKFVKANNVQAGVYHDLCRRPTTSHSTHGRGLTR
jgi:predicted DNA-binding protein with PD1-like motif